MPCHLKLEMERRPRAARRLGRVTVPPPHPVMRPPQDIREHDLAAHRLEVERRPVAAKRQGLFEYHTTPEVMAPAALARDAYDTAVFRMEADRRPVAAKRHGLVVCSAVRLAEDVLALAAAPLRDTACFAQEARRRPAAALRTAALTSVPVTLPAAAAAAVAAPFLATAAGAQEAARRPTAALRAGFRRWPCAGSADCVVVPALALADSECFAMEATRRPRAVARLRARDSAPWVDGQQTQRPVQQHRRRHSDRPTFVHPEMVGIAAEDMFFPAPHFAYAAAVAALAATEAESASVGDGDLTPRSLDLDKTPRSAGDEPNPFASLERMLESRLSENRNSGGGEETSRGSSLWNATVYPRKLGLGSAFTSNLSRMGHGSTGNLQRCVGTKNVGGGGGGVSRDAVSCGVDHDTGDVVCRVDDTGEVVMQCIQGSVGAGMEGLVCDIAFCAR